MSFGTVISEISSVSMQQCEKDFYNFIGYSGTLEIFGSQNGQRCLIIELCDSNAITAYHLHKLWSADLSEVCQTLWQTLRQACHCCGPPAANSFPSDHCMQENILDKPGGVACLDSAQILNLAGKICLGGFWLLFPPLASFVGACVSAPPSAR